MAQKINQTNKERFTHFTVNQKFLYSDFWNVYSNLKENPEIYRKRKKELAPFSYFKPRQFDDYLDNLPEEQKVAVFGNVFIRQRRYKEITEKYTEQDKQNDGHYGVVLIPYTEEYLKQHKKAEKYCRFDLHEAKDTGSHLFLKTIGYAEVGENRYVRLVRHTLWPLLLLLLLIGLIFLGLHFCSKDTPADQWIPGKENAETITEEQKGTPAIPPNYSYPNFQDRTITAKDKEIKLYNPKFNETGVQYYLNEDGTDVKRNAAGEPVTSIPTSSLWLAYELTEEGKTIVKTDYIKPGEQKAVDLYSKLSAGKHKINIHVSGYCFDDETQCTSYDNEITVMVKK